MTLAGRAGILARGGRSLIPDLVVVTTAAAARDASGFHAGDVVLVAEVVSPSNAADYLITNRALYEAHGIAHCWIVDIRDPRAPSAIPPDCGCVTCCP